MLNVRIDKGIYTKIEWLSSSERESIRLFSLMYQCVSLINPKWGVKNIAIIIDEPELHLHPTNAELFISWIEKAVSLFSSSNHITSAQILLATHSPLIAKKCLDYDNHAIRHIEDNGTSVTIKQKGLKPLRRVVSYAEIMYRYFDVVSSDFHDELYGALMKKVANSYSPPKDTSAIKTKCVDNYLRTMHNQGVLIIKDFPVKWENDRLGIQPYSYKIPVYLRNYIHHPENTKNAQIPHSDFEVYLRESIEIMDAIV